MVYSKLTMSFSEYYNNYTKFTNDDDVDDSTTSSSTTNTTTTTTANATTPPVQVFQLDTTAHPTLTDTTTAPLVPTGTTTTTASATIPPPLFQPVTTIPPYYKHRAYYDGGFLDDITKINDEWVQKYSRNISQRIYECINKNRPIKVISMTYIINSHLKKINNSIIGVGFKIPPYICCYDYDSMPINLVIEFNDNINKDKFYKDLDIDIPSLRDSSFSKSKVSLKLECIGDIYNIFLYLTNNYCDIMDILSSLSSGDVEPNCLTLRGIRSYIYLLNNPSLELCEKLYNEGFVRSYIILIRHIIENSGNIDLCKHACEVLYKKIESGDYTATKYKSQTTPNFHRYMPKGYISKYPETREKYVLFEPLELYYYDLYKFYDIFAHLHLNTNSKLFLEYSFKTLKVLCFLKDSLILKPIIGYFAKDIDNEIENTKKLLSKVFWERCGKTFTEINELPTIMDENFLPQILEFVTEIKKYNHPNTSPV